MISDKDADILRVHLNLKMEAAGSSGMVANIYQTARQHIPEESRS
jgi:hypothetical protein